MDDGATIIFAGPSLHGVDAATLEGFHRRPPAGCGDLLAAALQGAKAIGLIDGLFDHAPSVWHKEILYAISIGIPVYGAASMGALRGAECAAFGMIGVGAIFESYASGHRFADADVGVAHAPAELDFAPMSIALVDVEATLNRIAAQNVLAPEICDRLLVAAQRIHFKERTWPDIFLEAGLAEEALQEAERAVERLGYSQKQEDAMALLARMRTDKDIAPPAPNFTLSQSGFFVVLKSRVEAKLGMLGQ